MYSRNVSGKGDRLCVREEGVKSQPAAPGVSQESPLVLAHGRRVQWPRPWAAEGNYSVSRNRELSAAPGTLIPALSSDPAPEQIQCCQQTGRWGKQVRTG